MKFKDLLGLSLVSVFLFPVVLIAVMIGTGMARLEFGDRHEAGAPAADFLHAEPEGQEAYEEKQTKAFLALEAREAALKARKSELDAEAERLENLKLETVKAKEEIVRERGRIEELVKQSSQIQDKKIANLAEVYGAMRPDEAAPVLLSLEDNLVVRILQKVPEARSASKLLAAMAALDVRRAALITKLLGANARPAAKPSGREMNGSADRDTARSEGTRSEGRDVQGPEPKTPTEKALAQAGGEESGP